MPAFSFHWPRFLRSRRSRSRSNPVPHDDVAISHSTGIGPSLPSCPSSRLDVPGMDMTAMTAGASHSSPLGNTTDHQNSTARLPTARAPDDSSCQPSPASRPVTPGSIVPSNAARMRSSYASHTRQPTRLSPPSNHAHSVEVERLLTPLPRPATLLQQCANTVPLIPHAVQDLPQQQHQNQGNLSHAHNFTMNYPIFIDGYGNDMYVGPPANHFMKELLEKTIPGAEFDSSDRDPPPRCHPGTRLDILARCIYFVRTCDGKRKTRWVVGAAGVGKSAIMQSVVESPELAESSHASVFFSINGRDDGTKAVITISYQFAAKSEPYRQLIEREITRDPSLLRSSMAKQFLKLIVEPFIHHPELSSPGRTLVVIDGLDECKSPRTQLELLRLISDLCIEYPSSPLVWLIASRPEQHITSFFSQSDVAPAYEKEEIVVESDEARTDVERFLRDKLTEIKKRASDTVDPRWPEERDFWKLANAAGGLFAYAWTVIRYIDDVAVGSPASQFSVVLNVIDDHPMTDVQREEHPMALLDALYARILSNVPSKAMMNTRKFLLALAFDWDRNQGPHNFVLLCNWLGMTPDDAYAAINHLRSVLRVPRRDKARQDQLEFFHKSFMDYISDSTRSGFSQDIEHDARQLMSQCVFRILNEAPDGIDFGDTTYGLWYGTLRRGPGAGDKISVTWPVDEDVDGADNVMRFDMYKLAIEQVVAGMKRGDLTFQSEFCIRILSTRFEEYSGYSFPFKLLCNLVFDGSRRQELMMHGLLKQIPLKVVDFSTSLTHATKLQFHRPATTPNLSDQWNSSCEHGRESKWGEGDDQDWVTSFSPRRCAFCYKRLKHQSENCKTRSPDHAIPIFFTSTGVCCVEFQFVYPEDGMSEWTYWFWKRLSLKKRKKYGSDV